MDLSDIIQSLSVEDKQKSELKSSFKLGAINVGGHNTELVYGEFVNKYMIIVTQFEKIGTLLRVGVENQANGLNSGEPVYSVSLIFGAENIEQQAAARFIAGSLLMKKPLLIFICLKNYSSETVRAISLALKDLIDQ